MKEINFVKNIDNLGRIVIPMDIRRKLQINTGDVLSITCNDKNIMLTKYSNLDNNYKIVEILKCFVENFNIKVILTNKECVIYSNIVNVGSKLDNQVKLLVKNASTLKNQNLAYVFGENKVSGIYNMLPVVTNEGIEGSIIVFGDESEKAYEICILISKLIMLELNIT
ncbi:MAG: AbrB/MazE/SpoVT family DNA-binding domain-containing protein [Candidatus Coprovivens sp.]